MSWLPLAEIIDAESLLRVALVGFVATCGLVGSYGTAVLGLDRISAAREGANGSTPPAWVALVFVAFVVAIGIIVLGGWAMTQKD